MRGLGIGDWGLGIGIGSVGAAKGAGMGAGIYKDHNEAFATLKKISVIEPDAANKQSYADAYANWKRALDKALA